MSPEQSAAEQKKQEQVAAKRRAESAADRQKRIAKYEKDRKRDNQMMQQLTEAFNFTLLGQHKVRGFNVWALKATPRARLSTAEYGEPGSTRHAGQLWIDQESYNWVRVTAEVLHPVSIEGFLAQVEPGTSFELENSPVGNGIWQATHFAMRSNAKMLYMFTHNSQEDETYFDYQRIATFRPKRRSIFNSLIPGRAFGAIGCGPAVRRSKHLYFDRRHSHNFIGAGSDPDTGAIQFLKGIDGSSCFLCLECRNRAR